MRNNVVDLIVYLVKNMHIGVQLSDIKWDHLRGYNKSEISAAYSWLLQRYGTAEKQRAASAGVDLPPPRALHPTERTRISTEVYGYLLELYYLGIVDAGKMEHFIEYAMFQPDDSMADTSDVKEWIAGYMFGSDQGSSHQNITLKGTEKIH